MLKSKRNPGSKRFRRMLSAVMLPALVMTLVSGNVVFAEEQNDAIQEKRVPQKGKKAEQKR